MSEGKKYGLIIPKKCGTAGHVKSNIFDRSSDSEDIPVDNDARLILPIRTLKKDIRIKKQAQLDIERALSEDPTVFDYDSVYDDMKTKKEAEFKKKKGEEDHKPKYITNLLKAADQRKKEYERRMEKKIQKERENETDTFKDKEQFVTSSYKQKMLEMQQAEELERKQAALEASMDVTKQRDLGNFYRHLWKEETRETSASSAVNKAESGKTLVVPESSTAVSNMSKSSHNKNNEDKLVTNVTVESSQSKQDRSQCDPCSTSKAISATLSSSMQASCPKASSNLEFPEDKDISSSSESSASDSDSDDDNSKNVNRAKEAQKDKRSHGVHRTISDKSDSQHTSKDCSKTLVMKPNAHLEHSSDSRDKRQIDESDINRVAAQSSTSLDQASAKFAKRNTGETVDDAKARYLARKQTRHVPVVTDPNE